jgi:hypothetical protein
MKVATSLFRSALTACALTLVSVAAHASTINLKADLKASAEVPPKDSAGTGTLTATLNTETDLFTYHVEFSGLTGPVAAAHFHGPAPEGVNAKPQLPVKGTLLQVPSRARRLSPPSRQKIWWMANGISTSIQRQTLVGRFAGKY